MLSVFFSFLYCCSKKKKATSMIICASGFYTVVCDQSSKTPSWYCLLHLLYTKDTNALPALQVETPTAPPPSGPAQVRCRHFRFQSVAINKKAKFLCDIYHNLPGRKKKRKRRRRRQSNAESPNPRGSTDNIKEAESSFERRTRRHRWRWTMLMVKNIKITLSYAVQL